MLPRLLRDMPRPMAPPLIAPYDRAGSAPPGIVPAGRDGPDNVLVPECAEQWALIAPDILQPDYLFPCTDAGPNLVDVANSPGGVLTAGLNVAYRQPVPGWARLFAAITGEGGGSGFLALADQLWNMGNQSIFALMYSAFLQSGGPTRCLFLLGGNNVVHIQAPTAGQLGCFCNGTTLGTFIYESLAPIVYPITYSYDRRGAGLARVHTNKEQITSTWVNASDNVKGFGSNTLASPIARHGLLAVWLGNGAEFMIDRGGAGNGGKQVIGELGWPLAY